MFHRLINIKPTQQTAIAKFVSLSLLPLVAGAMGAFGSASLAVPAAEQRPLLEDGVYLEGEAPEPNRIGSAYMIYEAKQGRVVGAFYMPSSSFDCFYGTVDGQQMSLTVVESYSQEAFSHNVAFDGFLPIASSDGSTIRPKLEGFQPISSISEGDRRILEICKNDYQNRVGSEF